MPGGGALDRREGDTRIKRDKAPIIAKRQRKQVSAKRGRRA